MKEVEVMILMRARKYALYENSIRGPVELRALERLKKADIVAVHSVQPDGVKYVLLTAKGQYLARVICSIPME